MLMTDEKKGKLFPQVVVAVAIALLAGGSSPWWWEELREVFQSSDEEPDNRDNTETMGTAADQVPTLLSPRENAVLPHHGWVPGRRRYGRRWGG